MEASAGTTAFGPEYTPEIVTRIASCTAAISRLDAHISVASCLSAWRLRAAWSGYARALQLQSVEIDEIDVISWGCDLVLTSRSRRPTHDNIFASFEEWAKRLHDQDIDRTFDPALWQSHTTGSTKDHPPLVRALESTRSHARLQASLEPWLALPFAFHAHGLTEMPLPCLTGGAKAFRMKRRISAADWLSLLKDIEAQAETGLRRLTALERIRQEAERAISQEYRPGALPRLLALCQYQPLLSPQSVSKSLGLSIAGASKLLTRAAATGLVCEITERHNWRQFLARDLALDLGYLRPVRGRPRKEPSLLSPHKGMHAVYDMFDAEMAAIDRLLNRN